MHTIPVLSSANVLVIIRQRLSAFLTLRAML